MNLYFDNASTSFPKPTCVAEAISRFLTYDGGTYARASYGRVVQSTSMVERCRDMLSERLAVSDGHGGSQGEVFFAQNATMGSNTILKGIGLHSCRVLISPMEHNAVMRPLQYLSDNMGITIEVMPHDCCGRVDCEQLSKLDLTGVGLIIVNHQSNINGVIQPMEQIAKIAQHAVQNGSKKRIKLMVDLSQSLGSVPIALLDWNIDYAIFTGHKSLYGPTGIGGFYARDPHTIATTIHGGTGSKSDSYSMPESYPDRMEAGTPNTVGIVGLLAALENPPAPQHTLDQFISTINEIESIAGITVHCAAKKVADLRNECYNSIQGELFSITHNSLSPSILCRRLYDQYGIETRQGLHCAPRAHRSIGTFPNGTLRISPSAYHTPADFAHLVEALKTVTRHG